MAAIWNAVWSLLPQGSPAAQAAPKVGERAPEEPALNGVPSIVAFPRHCGCPFAQKEVISLGHLTQNNKGFQVVIVQHSPSQTTQEWFEAIG